MGIDLIEPANSGTNDASSAATPPVYVVRTGKLRRVAAGVAVLAVVALTVWLSRPQPQDEADDTLPPTTVLTPSTVATAPPDRSAVRADGPGIVEFEPSATPDPPRVVVATGDDELTLWSVDLTTGRAEEISLPPLPGEAAPPVLTDARFFGTDQVVAVDDADRYHLLTLDGTAARRERLIDLGTRLTFGVTGLTGDGSHVWAGISSGLIRWRLADDEVDARWIDSFGDQTQRPEVRVVTDEGLLVEGSGRNFLVKEDGSAQLLVVSGEVISGAGAWIISRACDEALRCGQLTLDNLATGDSITLNREYRFRAQCGLAAPGVEPGVAHLVAEYLGRLVLLTIGAGEPIVERELHPAGIGCVEAVAVSADRLVLAHERAITLVTSEDIELVHLDALGPIVAVGADAVETGEGQLSP